MRVIRTLLVIVLLLVVLVAAAIALLPARFVAEWLQPRVPALELQEVGGTVWRGHARNLRLHGQDVGALRWTVHPLALFGRRLDVDLAVDGAEYRGSGFASVRRDLVRIVGGRMTLDAQRMQPVLDVPALNLRGTVDIEIDSAELVAGFPRVLEGRATWRDAAVDGAAAATFGEIVAEFRTAADGALVGTVEDRGGPLAVDGQFRAALTGFEAEALLVARDGNPQVLDALRHIGEVQPDGSSVLQIRGGLLPWRR